MTVTKILGAQSGLQYQGVQDKSEADPRDSLANTLFTGQFKRGPFNKPFKVTKANIRAKLGYDPDNLQYQAIEDVLHQGVPFVWVMRVSSEGEGEGGGGSGGGYADLQGCTAGTQIQLTGFQEMPNPATYYLSWILEENGIKTTVTVHCNTAKVYDSTYHISGLISHLFAIGGLAKLGKSEGGYTPQYALINFITNGPTGYICGHDGSTEFEYEPILKQNFRPVNITFTQTPDNLKTQPNPIDVFSYMVSPQTIHSCGYNVVSQMVDEYNDYTKYPYMHDGAH